MYSLSRICYSCNIILSERKQDKLLNVYKCNISLAMCNGTGKEIIKFSDKENMFKIVFGFCKELF